MSLSNLFGDALHHLVHEATDWSVSRLATGGSLDLHRSLFLRPRPWSAG